MNKWCISSIIDTSSNIFIYHVHYILFWMFEHAITQEKQYSALLETRFRMTICYQRTLVFMPLSVFQLEGDKPKTYLYNQVNQVRIWEGYRINIENYFLSVVSGYAQLITKWVTIGEGCQWLRGICVLMWTVMRYITVNRKYVKIRKI